MPIVLCFWGNMICSLSLLPPHYLNPDVVRSFSCNIREISALLHIVWKCWIVLNQMDLTGLGWILPMPNFAHAYILFWTSPFEAPWNLLNCTTNSFNVFWQSDLLAMIFLVYGIFGILQTFGIIPANFLPYTDAVYSLIGACLFSFYLAYHTRLIVAGKHAKYQMNEKDYVFGAMTLYNDIINMFIYILRGRVKRETQHRW